MLEGDVQDMVGFVVGQMTFEKAEVLLDIIDQADLLSQQESGADPAGTDAFDAIGVFVMDIRGGHHGFGSLGSQFIREMEANSPPAFLEDSLLASLAFFSESSTHTKTILVFYY
jgi:hypothetical protein